MRKVIAMIMVAMVAGIASADLSISWDSGAAGAIYDVGGSGGAGPFVEGALVQLIWSTTPGITVAGDYALLGGATLADEWELDNSLTGAYGQGFSGGGIYADAAVGGNDISTGYFYTRVFQSAASAGESFLDIAGASPALAVYDPQTASTTYGDPVLVAAYNIDANTTTVIPEPATFGLMGVAALGMFLARKKARS